MAWTARGTIAGGVFRGPQGSMIGGVTGCVIGYIRSEDDKMIFIVLKNKRQHKK